MLWGLDVEFFSLLPKPIAKNLRVFIDVPFKANKLPSSFDVGWRASVILP